jgi:biotin transport system substrate-specific component
MNIGPGLDTLTLTDRSAPVRRALAVGAAALVVAASAQVSVPVPLSPIPMTLQPLAVLTVGGLLGATAGAAALVLYLALGLLGLPVFFAGGTGIGHVLGPTGGYLLAFPLAAALSGKLAGASPRLGRVLLGCALAMAVIHAGGTAQLAMLGGDPGFAFRAGFVPFLTGDLLKVGIATAVILGLGPKLRTLL